MSKATTNTVRIEAWNVDAKGDKRFKDGRKVVTKVAVRNHLGQFHSATNFRGTTL